jgi:hypothetical protein
MKFKTTEKAIKANYSKIIKVGYCNLQYLLRYETPIAYTCGKVGWKADIYEFNGILIVTGYQPFGNISADYDLCEEYEERAQKIINSRPSRPDTELKKLINLFIINVQVKNNKKEG